NESMYLEGGHAYVYMVYGMHHCMNVVCGPAEGGTAVLIRALERVEGLERMAAHRRAAANLGRAHLRALCSGPAKLTQALRIDRRLDGTDLRVSDDLFIEAAPRRMAARRVAEGPRIGVAYAGAWAL